MAVIEHLMHIIRNLQNKEHEIVTALAQLHLDYTRENLRLTLYNEETEDKITRLTYNSDG